MNWHFNIQKELFTQNCRIWTTYLSISVFACPITLLKKLKINLEFSNYLCFHCSFPLLVFCPPLTDVAISENRGVWGTHNPAPRLQSGVARQTKSVTDKVRAVTISDTQFQSAAKCLSEPKGMLTLRHQYYFLAKASVSAKTPF